MRRKLLAVIALAVVLSLVMAVPVSAKRVARGVMDLDFNQGFMTGVPCAEFTWAGTVDFKGDVYGIAYIPSSPPKLIGLSFHFRDYWMLYETPFTFDTNGVITDCSGTPVLWGKDKGVQDNRTLKAWARGRIKGADPAHFPEKLIGRSVFWKGITTFSPLGRMEFAGPFRIER